MQLPNPHTKTTVSQLIQNSIYLVAGLFGSSIALIVADHTPVVTPLGDTRANPPNYQFVPTPDCVI